METASFISWSCLFLAAVGIVTWYTASGKEHVVNNKESLNKMTMLNEAMQSTLGRRWPFVLLFIIILLGIGMYLFYIISQKEPLQINVSDELGKKLNISLIIFIVLFSLLMLFLAINGFLNYKKKQNSGNVTNYIPSIDQDKKDKQILIIIGLGLLILFGGGFGIWYSFFRKPK